MSPHLNRYTATSPLDGRYWDSAGVVVSSYLSPLAIYRTMVEIEIRYLFALSEAGIIRALSGNERTYLMSIYSQNNFSESDMERIGEIEGTTRHDVKAVEYYVRERLEVHPTLSDLISFVHFGLTSEDVTNLAWALNFRDFKHVQILPRLAVFIKFLARTSLRHVDTVMPGRTHGQFAVPTTFGKELAVFVESLIREYDLLSDLRMEGKIGGAVGTLAAHKACCPDVDWVEFVRRFVQEELELKARTVSTQILPYDCFARHFDSLNRISLMLYRLSEDMWEYTSRGYFNLKVVGGEVGSSAMPHKKANPIDFENACGNLDLVSHLFAFYTEKLLGRNKMQRDLSDSTVRRDIPLLLGRFILGLGSLQEGFSRIEVDSYKMREDVLLHPEVLSEYIQTVLRSRGDKQAYEKVRKLLLEGRSIGEIFEELGVDEIPPDSYIGEARRQVERAASRFV